MITIKTFKVCPDCEGVRYWFDVVKQEQCPWCGKKTLLTYPIPRIILFMEG